MIAYSYECPRLNQLDHGLSKTKLFTVSLNEHGTASLQCYSPHSDAHECEIRKVLFASLYNLLATRGYRLGFVCISLSVAVCRCIDA